MRFTAISAEVLHASMRTGNFGKKEVPLSLVSIATGMSENADSSNRITDDILAMQRPSTKLIQEHDLTRVFLELGISCIFNLQVHGEHASCGPGNESESGL